MATNNPTVDSYGHPTIQAAFLVEGAVYSNNKKAFLLLSKKSCPGTTQEITLTWLDLSRNRIIGPANWLSNALLRAELLSEP